MWAITDDYNYPTSMGWRSERIHIVSTNARACGHTRKQRHIVTHQHYVPWSAGRRTFEARCEVRCRASPHSVRLRKTDWCQRTQHRWHRRPTPSQARRHCPASRRGRQARRILGRESSHQCPTSPAASWLCARLLLTASVGRHLWRRFLPFGLNRRGIGHLLQLGASTYDTKNHHVATQRTSMLDVHKQNKGKTICWPHIQRTSFVLRKKQSDNDAGRSSRCKRRKQVAVVRKPFHWTRWSPDDDGDHNNSKISSSCKQTKPATSHLHFFIPSPPQLLHNRR